MSWNDYRVHTVLVSFVAFLMIIMALLWLVTGSPEALYLLGVLVVSSVVIKLSKTLMFHLVPIASRRPDGASDCHIFPCANTASKTGMPSGHAASAVMLLVYTLWFVVVRSHTPSIQKVVASVVVTVFAVAVVYSRVVYKCHTWGQVAAGSLLGVAMGVTAIRGRVVAGLG